MFAGTILLIKSSLDGLDIANLSPADKFTQVANALNGYSFGAIWIPEGQLSDPVVGCGPADFDGVLASYPAFERANGNPFSDLDASANPYDVLDPQVGLFQQILLIEKSRKKDFPGPSGKPLLPTVPP